MSEKSPEYYPLITYACLLLMSILGGIVHFFHRVKGERSWFRFTGDVLTGIFCGYITFHLCALAKAPHDLCLVIASLSANMSNQSLHVFKQILINFFGKK